MCAWLRMCSRRKMPVNVKDLYDENYIYIVVSREIFKEFPERYINMQLQGWQLCDIKFDNVINMKISKQQYISSNFTYFDKKIN